MLLRAYCTRNSFFFNTAVPPGLLLNFTLSCYQIFLEKLNTWRFSAKTLNVIQMLFEVKCFWNIFCNNTSPFGLLLNFNSPCYQIFLEKQSSWRFSAETWNWINVLLKEYFRNNFFNKTVPIKFKFILLLDFSMVGNSLIGVLSKSLIFCEKMRERVIRSKNERFSHLLIFGEWPERFAHGRSFLVSHLSESLMVTLFW